MSSDAQAPPPAAPQVAVSPTVGLGRIGQIAVPVTDVGRAAAFYRDVLGMRFLFETPTLAFFDADGVRLMLAAPETEAGRAADDEHPPRPTTAWVLYFQVKELELAVRNFTARGAELERGPHFVASLPDHDLWMAFIRDSEGNAIGLMHERLR